MIHKTLMEIFELLSQGLSLTCSDCAN